MIGGISMWSVWQPDLNVFHNAYFIARPGANLIVDPLPLSDSDFEEISRRGGVAWIALTNRHRERDARACADRFGAKIAAGASDTAPSSLAVDRIVSDGDELCGARVIALRGLKAPDAYVLHFRDARTVLVGDAIRGDPAGSLQMISDEHLIDARAAVLSVRRLRARRPLHLLVGTGTPIFNYAFDSLTECLEARTDTYAERVNVEELEFAYGSDTNDFDVQRDSEPYVGGWAEIGWLLGATKLGYAAARLEPGQALCPLHWHTSEEELCVALDGTATVRTTRGEIPLRRGDLVAFPTRSSGAHKIVNEGTEPCTILLVANVDSGDVTFYPDSRKLYVEATGTMVRDNPQLDYFDGETGNEAAPSRP